MRDYLMARLSRRASREKWAAYCTRLSRSMARRTASRDSTEASSPSASVTWHFRTSVATRSMAARAARICVTTCSQDFPSPSMLIMPRTCPSMRRRRNCISFSVFGGSVAIVIHPRSARLDLRVRADALQVALEHFALHQPNYTVNFLATAEDDHRGNTLNTQAGRGSHIVVGVHLGEGDLPGVFARQPLKGGSHPQTRS